MRACVPTAGANGRCAALAAAGSGGGGGGKQAEWACGKCTLVNTGSRDVCELCHAPRPAAAAAPEAGAGSGSGSGSKERAVSPSGKETASGSGSSSASKPTPGALSRAGSRGSYPVAMPADDDDFV